MDATLLSLAIIARKKDKFFFILLACCYEASMPRSLYSEKLNPDSLSDHAFERFFRFKRPEFARLLLALQFPAELIVESRYEVSGEECLMILLRRLAYPARLCDLSKLFGRSESVLSSIFNYALDHVFEKTRHLLKFDWERLDSIYLEKMCALNREKGSLLNDCVGFIDGTVRPICRPTRNQRDYYNGHRRVHSLKFQSITCPDGIVIFSDGPYAGRQHDAGLFRESRLGEILENGLRGADGRQLCIYGDAAYPQRPYLVSPFKGSQLSLEQRIFNARMAGLRIAVELSFGKAIRLFPFVDFKKNQKLLLQPVGKYYLVATVFANCHTCCYGSQVNDLFDSEPPTMEEYLRLM